MQYLTRSAIVVASLLLTAVAPSAAVAQSTGLEDMVGARAGQAEGELARRGYVNTGGQQGDDRVYANWWNADRRQCVTISTMNGRYDAITPTTPGDCRQSANNRSRQRAPRYSSGSGADYAPVRTSDLSRFCRGEAAAAFDRRPAEITTAAPIRQRDGSTVQGWFDGGGRRTTFFTCRFDYAGRFLGVN